MLLVRSSWTLNAVDTRKENRKENGVDLKSMQGNVLKSVTRTTKSIDGISTA